MKFYNPVIRIPSIGKYYNIIVPIFISFFCVLFFFNNVKKLVNIYMKSKMELYLSESYDGSLYQKGEEVLLEVF